jgi:hypothetical protein
MWNDTDGNGVPDGQEPVGLSSLVGGLPTDGIKVVQSYDGRTDIGLVEYRILTEKPGDTVTVELRYQDDIPEGAVWFMYH